MRKLRERVAGKQRPFVVRFDSLREFERDADRMRGQGLYLVSSGYAPDGTVRTVWSGDGRYAGCEAGAPEHPTLPFEGADAIASPDSPAPDLPAPPHRPRLAEPPVEASPVGWWEVPHDAAPAPAPLHVQVQVAEASTPVPVPVPAPVPAAAPAEDGPPVIAVTSFAETTAAIRELFAGHPVVLDLARADADTARRVIGFFESYCRSSQAEIVEADAAHLTIVPAA